MFKINYEESYKNNFKIDVKGAVAFYLKLHIVNRPDKSVSQNNGNNERSKKYTYISCFQK